MRLTIFRKFIVSAMCVVAAAVSIAAQPANQNNDRRENREARRQTERNGRPVTIPIGIRPKDDDRRGELIEAGNLIVTEDGEPRTILSLRNTTDTQLQFAVLIQDDAVSQVNNELDGIRDFIRRLPRGSRVMVGYLRAGDIQVRQRFTEDLERAAKSLRIITSSAAVSPFNPYVGVVNALERFDNLPTGRRAILVVSDGLDTSRGIDSASPTQSIDLDRAILRAQRNGTAIYSIYTDTVGGTGNGRGGILSSYGQGSLNRLSEETGGRAFFSGLSTPVSFSPFLRDLNLTLNRQFALTYLSTGDRKDFRRIEVKSDNPAVEIEHPRGVRSKN